MNFIHVDNLVEHYRVHRQAVGLRGSVRSLFRRQYETVKAVDGISFDIAPGEIVGFLGPNGAGKTTTLKCLSGLLYPTSGQVNVLGFTPHKRERSYLAQFTLVMGQRNQLLWDLPAMETFLVNQAIYGVPEKEFREMLDELVALLNLEPLLTKQVRKLSLGAGNLSVKLLKPLDPFHYLFSEQIGWKVFILLFIVPVVMAIAWLPPAIQYPLSLGRAVAFALSVIAALVLAMLLT